MRIQSTLMRVGGVHTAIPSILDSHLHQHVLASTRWLLYSYTWDSRSVYFITHDDGPQRSICVVAATDNVIALESEHLTRGYLYSFDIAATFCYRYFLVYHSIPNRSVQLTLNVSLAPHDNECARRLFHPSIRQPSLMHARMLNL